MSRFNHVLDPTREASIEVKDPEGVLVAHFVDAGGKGRKKTFNKLKTGSPLSSAWQAAMKFLLEEGFRILPTMSDGPVKWLTWTDERYGSRAAKCGSNPEFVWIPDSHDFRRVTRSTGELEERPSAFGKVIDVAPRRDGGAYALVTSKGVCTVLSVSFDQDPDVLFEVKMGSSAAMSLSVTEDGLLLAPHDKGAALYSPNADVVKVLSCAPRTPRTVAAVSPSGEWFAYPTESAILVSSEDETLVLPHDGYLFDVSIDDAGRCTVNGQVLDGALPGAPGHDRGVFGVGHTLVDVLPMIGVGGKRKQLSKWCAIEWDYIQHKVTRWLPVPELAPVKNAHACVSPDGHWILRSDTHVVIEVDPELIPKTKPDKALTRLINKFQRSNQ